MRKQFFSSDTQLELYRVIIKGHHSICCSANLRPSRAAASSSAPQTIDILFARQGQMAFMLYYFFTPLFSSYIHAQQLLFRVFTCLHLMCVCMLVCGYVDVYLVRQLITDATKLRLQSPPAVA